MILGDVLVLPLGSGAAATAPGAPTGLSATATADTLTLNWSAPASNGGAAITNYKVYSSTSSGTETLLTTVGNVLTYAHAATGDGVQRFYKVSAINSAGEGAKSGEATGTTYLFRATFTAADGTAVGSYTPEVGPALTTNGGTWSVQSNKLKQTDDGAGVAEVYADAGVFPVTAQVDFAVGADPNGHIQILEYGRADATHFYRVILEGDGGGGQTLTLGLQKRVGGAPAFIAGPVGLDGAIKGTTATIKAVVTALGGHTVYVNGVSTLTATNTEVAGTGVGLLNVADNATYFGESFDNLTVTR